MADINRDVSIEQIDYTIDINNIEYSIEINPQSTFAIELNEQGPQGATGPRGEDGYSLCYIHEQGIASDTWEITHNLNKYPSVTLVDSANVMFQGEIHYIDENNCIVYMNGATKGKAYLN